LSDIARDPTKVTPRGGEWGGSNKRDFGKTPLKRKYSTRKLWEKRIPK